jgi:radical SAM protein with 4Fe4S-binding SPASM domain
MSKENFVHILEKIKSYTKYIYLHVKGEALLHKDIYDFILMAESFGIKVNITSNGTIFNHKILELSALRQFNFSLHSFEKGEGPDKLKYIKNIMKYTLEAQKHGKISSLRLWNMVEGKIDEDTSRTVKIISDFYNLKINIDDKILKKGIKLSDKIYLNFEERFEWPNLNNNYRNERGFCYGLNSHIAILVDGTVVPCCLDDNGLMVLGNIFKNDLDYIINDSRAVAIVEGFKKRLCAEELCKSCSFKSRFDKL